MGNLRVCNKLHKVGRKVGKWIESGIQVRAKEARKASSGRCCCCHEVLYMNINTPSAFYSFGKKQMMW